MFCERLNGKSRIELVVQESRKCLRLIDEMFEELEMARPDLVQAQYQELRTRFDWMREVAVVRRTLNETYWRFRYLRHLHAMRTTEPEQMRYIVEAYDKVQEHSPKLFQYDPKLKFSCYDTTLGNVERKPSLGNPQPLMQELYERCRVFVEDTVGPSYSPKEWKR